MTNEEIINYIIDTPDNTNPNVLRGILNEQITVEPLSITENGTVTASTGKAYSPITVDVPTGGGKEAMVYFIDYDGEILHSYTATKWAGVSALPANPSHSGLVAQGWNWTKAQIDAQLLAIPDGDVWVGQMYITDDGKTRLYVHFEEGRTSPYLALCPNGTVTVDWGDGSNTDTLTGTNTSTIKSVQHVYQVGDYVITLTPSDGTEFAAAIPSGGSVLLSADGQNSNRAYQGAIKKVEIGAGFTSVTVAFNACSNLASITIPSGITSIGSNTFQGCYNLTSITIPSSVTSVGNVAFGGCSSLTSITIPSSVASIGNYVFQSCSSLTSITIPSNVTSVGQSAFNNCYNLTSITIPSGVTSLGDGVFSGCSGLTNIDIPSSVTSIGSTAFGGCSSLTSITIPSGVTSIGSNTFQNCSGLISIDIPSSVTSIGNYAFQSCFGLTNIDIPSGITSIGSYVFQSCYSLISIDIPSGVTSIEKFAFQNCYSLANVTIPSSVASIGNSAFNYCNSLAYVRLASTTPPTLGTNVFAYTASDFKIYVPYSADHSVLEAYQTAPNWASYASKMVEEEPQDITMPGEEITVPGEPAYSDGG